MIEQEAQEILNKRSVSLQGVMLNQLTDQFRVGRNPNDILNLINSDDKNLIDIGIYIIGEIIIDDDLFKTLIIERLYELLNYEDSSIRHSVLIILSPLLKERDLNEAKEVYLKMSSDRDDLVKRTAKKLLDTGKLY